MYQYQMKI